MARSYPTPERMPTAADVDRVLSASRWWEGVARMAPLLLLAGIVAFAITLSLPLAAAIYVTEMGLWFFAIWRWTTLSRRGLAMSNRLPPSEALMVLEKHRPR